MNCRTGSCVEFERSTSLSPTLRSSAFTAFETYAAGLRTPSPSFSSRFWIFSACSEGNFCKSCCTSQRLPLPWELATPSRHGGIFFGAPATVPLQTTACDRDCFRCAAAPFLRCRLDAPIGMVEALPPFSLPVFQRFAAAKRREKEFTAVPPRDDFSDPFPRVLLERRGDRPRFRDFNLADF